MSMEEDRLEALTWIDTSYDQPVYDTTVTRDITTQRQDVGSSSNDQWGGFFQKAVGTVLDYGIKRDAAQTGVQLQRASLQAQRNPYYVPGTQTGNSQGLTINQLVLFGGLFFVVMAMKK